VLATNCCLFWDTYKTHNCTGWALETSSNNKNKKRKLFLKKLKLIFLIFLFHLPHFKTAHCPKTSILMMKNVHCCYNHFQIKVYLYSAWWYFCRNLLPKTNDVNNHIPLYLRRAYSETTMLRNLMGRKRPLGRSNQTKKIIKMHKT
jgi:hypothetical protein